LDSDLEPPFLCLLISGGHTQLIYVEGYNQFKLLGETLDDAVGEAYDKFARIMGLNYPGGPKIDTMAAESTGQYQFNLPVAKTQGEYDFSFSGLKTAVSRQYETLGGYNVTDKEIASKDLAAAFQKVIIKALSQRVFKAVELYNLNKIVIAGGVAANKGIRNCFEAWQNEAANNRLFFSPQFKYCTDNAAMIASAAYFSPLTNALESDVFSRSVQAEMVLNQLQCNLK
jgi:N6-L-threonylcarbamoyladenine synthase